MACPDPPAFFGMNASLSGCALFVQMRTTNEFERILPGHAERGFGSGAQEAYGTSGS